MSQNQSDAARDSISVTVSYTFAHCQVHFIDAGRYTETVFHDGTKVCAVPDESEEYRAKARLYGYEYDCAALSREHEFLHSFLAQRLRGGGASHALWAVAHGQVVGEVAPLWEQEQEEAQVLAFQQYLNGAAPSREICDLAGGLDALNRLKDEAATLLHHFRP